MNERIKELMEQAEKQVRVTVKSDLGYLGFEIDEDEFRGVFAQLIVAECASKVDSDLRDWLHDNSGGTIGDKLKEYFGVEE